MTQFFCFVFVSSSFEAALEWRTKEENVFVRTVKHFFLCLLLTLMLWWGAGQEEETGKWGKNRWISNTSLVCTVIGRKQVVDIQSLSFRDHLSPLLLTLIYFGTANKVQKKRIFFFCSFSSLFLSLSHSPSMSF